jgi:hypothetical protein
MVDVKASSLSWCALLPHPGLHELGTSAADMAQHLIQPLYTIAKYKCSLLWEGWAWEGLYAKYRLQLPLKLTVSARNLHCRAATLY